jgi:hypothetical protein
MCGQIFTEFLISSFDTRITYESLDVFNYVKMIVIYRFNIVQMNGHWRLMWIPYFLCFTNFHGYHGWYQTMILRIQWIFVHTFICTDYRKVYTHLYVLTIERYPQDFHRWFYEKIFSKFHNCSLYYGLDSRISDLICCRPLFWIFISQWFLLLNTIALQSWSLRKCLFINFPQLGSCKHCR